MKRELYDTIVDCLKKGHDISVNFDPYHKGLDVRIKSDLKEIENSKKIKDEFSDWWYEELFREILIPNGIVGGGTFDFNIIEEDLFVNSEISLQAGGERKDLTDFIGPSFLDWLRLKTDNLIQNKDYLCFKFFYGEKSKSPFSSLTLSYYVEEKDDFEKIILSKRDLSTLKKKLVEIFQDWSDENSKRFENYYFDVTCDDECNICSIYEGYNFDFEFKVPKNDL